MVVNAKGYIICGAHIKFFIVWTISVFHIRLILSLVRQRNVT